MIAEGQGESVGNGLARTTAMKAAWLVVPLVAALCTLHAGAAPQADVLDGRATRTLTLTAPLASLRSRAAQDEKASVSGSIALTGAQDDAAVEVLVSERGHTSRNPSECAFPKLRLEFVSPNRTVAPFEGIDVLKIGTHCGEAEPGTLTPKYGRLANELAPRREAMVYHLLEAAGVKTLRAAAARITYVFSDEPSRVPLTRYALLLEDDDTAAARLGAERLLEEESFGSATAQFREADTARLAFAEAMIGNFDWCLRMFPGDIYRCDDRHPLWNILGLDMAGSPDVPLPFDFDLAGPVVERHVWFHQVFDETFVEPPSAVQVEVQAQVQRTRSLFGRARLDDTRAAFVRARTGIERALADADVDDHGRAVARAYVDAFYAAITDDARFYQPVVREGGHQAWLDAEGRTPACGPDVSSIPEGTPVGAPLAVRNGRTQVRLLDALWKWVGDNRCDAVHRQPVWVDSNALGTDYPR